MPDTASKVMTMAEAVERFVPDGSSVALGLALEPLIPFSAGHEMIRQQRRDLSLVGPISDGLFDQLIGAGCVTQVVAAWVGNVSEGLGHCYRRAAERGTPVAVATRDHTNFSISLALRAAAWGVPYLPTITLLGSDILDRNDGFQLSDGLVRVPAVVPDVAFLHVQRADAEGRAHVWGPLGVMEEGGLAAARVVVSCEELVSPDVILSDPNRILLPEAKVVAVVPEPGGAHPSPVQGYWRRDHDFYRGYARRSRDESGFNGWLDEWVMGVRDRADYMQRLPLGNLRISAHRYAASVDYGAD